MVLVISGGYGECVELFVVGFVVGLCSGCFFGVYWYVVF